jgi:hypothetical protein
MPDCSTGPEFCKLRDGISVGRDGSETVRSGPVSSDAICLSGRLIVDEQTARVSTFCGLDINEPLIYADFFGEPSADAGHMATLPHLKLEY